MIVILDKQKREYSALSQRILTILAKEIKLLNKLNKVSYETEQSREKALHEVRQVFISLVNQTRRLERRLNRNEIIFTTASNKMNVFKNLEDIKGYARQSIAFFTNAIRGAGIENLYDETIKNTINEINSYISDQANNYTKIRAVCTRAILAHGASNVAIVMQNISPILYVKLPESVLSDAINNLLDNAIKYGKPNSKIIISETKRTRYYELHITNDSVKIKPDEYFKIYEKSYRGQQVAQNTEMIKWKKKKGENQGYGLCFLHQIAYESDWRGSILFKEIASIDEVWSTNRFTLVFPENLIKDEK